MMSIVLISTMVLDAEKNNKPVKWGTIIELYSHKYTHILVMVDRCCHHEHAVRYLTASGLQRFMQLGNMSGHYAVQ